MILRAKGIVDGCDTWYEFDMVPGEHEIRPCGPDVTGKLCVIGSQLKEHEIAELFTFERMPSPLGEGARGPDRGRMRGEPDAAASYDRQRFALPSSVRFADSFSPRGEAFDCY